MFTRMPFPWMAVWLCLSAFFITEFFRRKEKSYLIRSICLCVFGLPQFLNDNFSLSGMLTDQMHTGQGTSQADQV